MSAPLSDQDELSGTAAEMVDVHLGVESVNAKPDVERAQSNFRYIDSHAMLRMIPKTESVWVDNISQAQQLGKLTWHLPEYKFDVKQLKPDLQRVKAYLQDMHNEHYALCVIFVIQTAIHLHRAWNMTPLTNNILRDLKNKFKLHMTWELHTFRLKFRMEEGAHEVHRHVPYDYDSEFQDKYYRIAAAVMRGSIDIQRALQYQVDVASYEHTAATGIFVRDNPCSGPRAGLVSGRIAVYPLVSASCAVIFFGGDEIDALVAAITGLVSGLVEWAAGHAGQDGRLTLDLLVGLATGLITGFVYHIMGESVCISSILLGTLYWFFYGTAFVIAIIEIVSGDLQTGVVRFVAVAIKTFCLSMGAGLGLMMTCQGNTHENWWNSVNNECGNLDLDDYWWRIPLYLLCSVGVLGQYRFPIRYYWRALSVQLVGYEMQYQLLLHFGDLHTKDNMDYAAANGAAAVVSVFAATILSRKFCHTPYYDRIIKNTNSSCNSCMQCTGCCMQCRQAAGLLPGDSLVFEEMLPRLQQLADPKDLDMEAIPLTEQQEKVLLRTVVEEENWNIWALLMPTVYQLVPGSMIAKLWFNALFPPTSAQADYDTQNNVSYNLMVIATSLALGLILGLALTRAVRRCWRAIKICCGCKQPKPSGWHDTSFYEDVDPSFME